MHRIVIRLGVALVVLAAVLAGVDLAIRHFVATALADRAKQATGAQSSSASISGFPFLYDGLVQGQIHGVTVDLSNVPAGHVPTGTVPTGTVPTGTALLLQSVHVDLAGVKLDKTRLMHERKLVVTSVARGTATIDVSIGELSSVAGRRLTIDSQGHLEVAGARLGPVAATAAITGGHILEVTAGGVRVLQADLARSPVVPASCSPMTVRVTSTGIEATCSMAPVPAAVLAVVSAH